MEPTHFESLYPATSREQEIKQIFDYIQNGSSAQITGLPGIGRATVLELLSYNRNVRIHHVGDNQKWFHFVLLHCAEIKDRPLFDVTKFIFLSLADSLRDRGLKAEHDKIHTIFKEHTSFNDELVLFQGLKEAMDFLTHEKELTIILMFDRFEEYIPSLTPAFFAHLRILRDRAKYRFSALFSTPRPLEELIDQAYLADFYEFVSGNIVYLPIFDKPSMEFRISYLEKARNQKIEKDLIEQIYKLTGGHGKLTRIAIEELMSDHNNTNALGSLLLEKKPVQHALFEIWNFLTPAEQNALIQNNAENDSFLEKAGLISEGKISIPLLEQFVKIKSLATEGETEKITLNENTNEITKGHLVLSENLTAAEFKLLKHLIQNAEKVLEREEVIQAVWGDAKSTAGVTDQALDQLIFRLRKKIEDDPNNPQHVQTIKGRGFRFVP